MPPKEHYNKRLRSAHEAIDLVRNGDVVVVPTGVGEPPALLHALSDRRRKFRDVRVAQMLPRVLPRFHRRF
jgi:acyl-CoA hydrolase